MLRSMLYVRYGSGCSRRQPASAARPSAGSSRQSKSASPSSGVSRPPSTAFCKRDGMVEVKANPPPGQTELAGEHVKMVESRLLTRPQIKVNDAGKVAAAKAGVQAKPGSLRKGDLADPRAAAPLRFPERLRHGPQVYPFA